jgi:hypothetical protein
VSIREIYFLPPLAIARLGASTTPLDCFVWATDKSIHGGSRTTIQPDVSLRVMGDGSLRPFMPNAIQFRDGDLLRPVAPFFELWATVEKEGKREAKQVTVGLLKDEGVELDSVKYTITVANRKAHRRTLKAACAYIARVSAAGDDHERKALRAISPRNADEKPLVTPDDPIHLGYFQVVKPIDRKSMGIDLTALRVRFTPATGQVYGPRGAVAGPASPLPPGEALSPVTLGGRLHGIVPEQNRILNDGTKWTDYVMEADDKEDPQPSDSYDGANVGDNRSWGVVDDSCDGIIEAQVVIRGVRHVATARVLSSCPDFAPDRRPLVSFADDLADRDEGPIVVDQSDETIAMTQAEIADLFARAFETASLINLDSNRYRAIKENVSDAQPDPLDAQARPRVNFDSMTAKDKPFADLTANLFPSAPDPRDGNLPYTDAAHLRHGELCDVETLLDFLEQHADQVKRLIRPPFGRFEQLAGNRRSKSNPDFRDPRVARDKQHDMRMPPYMRDSDTAPLSLTVRQYDALMALVKISATRKGISSPVTRRVGQFMQRRKEAPDE